MSPRIFPVDIFESFFFFIVKGKGLNKMNSCNIAIPASTSNKHSYCGIFFPQKKWKQNISSSPRYLQKMLCILSFQCDNELIFDVPKFLNTYTFKQNDYVKSLFKKDKNLLYLIKKIWFCKDKLSFLEGRNQITLEPLRKLLQERPDEYRRTWGIVQKRKRETFKHCCKKWLNNFPICLTNQ